MLDYPIWIEGAAYAIVVALIFLLGKKVICNKNVVLSEQAKAILKALDNPEDFKVFGNILESENLIIWVNCGEIFGFFIVNYFSQSQIDAKKDKERIKADITSEELKLVMRKAYKIYKIVEKRQKDKTQEEFVKIVSKK